MILYLTKLVISAAIIVAVSEIAKRSTTLGGLLASLPLVSILSMIWIYAETKNTERIAAFSWSVLWLVIPSLLLFIALPLLLKVMHFVPALAISMLIMMAGYAGFVAMLKHFGVGNV